MDKDTALFHPMERQERARFAQLIWNRQLGQIENMIIVFIIFLKDVRFLRPSSGRRKRSFSI